MDISKLKKYHVSVFTTNLIAVVMSTLFLKGYKARGADIMPLFIFLLLILGTFILVFLFIIKPSKKIKKVLPNKPFLFINLILAFLISIIFLNDIGFLGVLFVLLFSFLLFEAEHIVQGIVGKRL